MASLVTPELEDFDASDGRGSVVQPKPQVQPIEREPEQNVVTNHTVLDSKGKPSNELPDFLAEAEKMEGQRERGEEPEKPKKVDRRQREQKIEAKPDGEASKEEPKSEAKTEQKPDPLPDDMLKVTPNDKPLTARRISQLLEKVEFRDKTLAEKEAIIKELQTKTATSQGSAALSSPLRSRLRSRG